ncbi:MAG: hypothetical protein FJX72_09785, partial [Armatimonadetes bacterium]|nr:hypothetical protein [Armatimonadota bacterium]
MACTLRLTRAIVGALVVAYGVGHGPTTRGAFSLGAPGSAWAQTPTQLDVSDVTGAITDTVTLSATLTTLTGDPVADVQIAFTVDGAGAGSATTNTSGVATTPYVIPAGPTGDVPIDASFAGNETYAASSGSGALTRQQADTKVYVPDRTGEVLGSVLLRGYLYRLDNTPVPGKLLVFNVDGTEVGSVVTTGTGKAETTYGPIPPGPASRALRVDWAGDDGYLASSGTGALSVTKPGVHVFVVAKTTVPGDIFRPRALLRRLPDHVPQQGRAITFKVDGTSIGTAQTNSSGIALGSHGQTTMWAMGSHACDAEFAGDDYLSPGTGATTFNVLAGISFGAPLLYSVPQAQQMAAADFDGDSHLDIAVGSLDGNLYVLWGNGDGTFGGPSAYPIGRGGHDVIAVDVNGDLRLDIVECQDQDGRIAVVPNLGGRAFGAPTYYAVGPKPYGVATGDFDRDGDPDLAVSLNGNQSLAVIRNNGDGTFGAATNYGAGQFPALVLCADINRDGYLDLAVTTMYDDYINLFRGNGNGGFAHFRSIRPGSYPNGMAWGDLDGDGMGDLAVVNQYSHTVNVLFTGRNRSYALSDQFASGGYPYRTRYAHIDADGRPDLVVSNGDISFTVLRNIGGRTLSGPFTFAAAGSHGRP